VKRTASPSHIIFILLAFVMFGFNNCGVVDVTKMKGVQQEDNGDGTVVGNPGDGGPIEGPPGGPVAANLVTTFSVEICESLGRQEETDVSLCRNELLTSSEVVVLICEDCGSNTLAEIMQLQRQGSPVQFGPSAQSCLAKIRAHQPPEGQLTGFPQAVSQVKTMVDAYPECQSYIITDFR